MWVNALYVRKLAHRMVARNRNIQYAVCNFNRLPVEDLFISLHALLCIIICFNVALCPTIQKYLLAKKKDV